MKQLQVYCHNNFQHREVAQANVNGNFGRHISSSLLVRLLCVEYTEAMFLLYMDTINKLKRQLPKTNRWKTKHSPNLDNFWCNSYMRTLPEKWPVSSLELENLICKFIILKIYVTGILKTSVIFQNKSEKSTPTLVRICDRLRAFSFFRVLKLTKLTNFLLEPAYYLYRVMYKFFF